MKRFPQEGPCLINQYDDDAVLQEYVELIFSDTWVVDDPRPMGALTLLAWRPARADSRSLLDVPWNWRC